MCLFRDKKGKFKKGYIGYRPPKGYRSSPATEFKKGCIPFSFKGIGVPSIVNHHIYGLHVVTVIADTRVVVSRGRRYKTKKRISYARYVFGLDKIPKDYIVYHKDNNPLNNNIENLKLMSRAELLYVNKYKKRGDENDKRRYEKRDKEVSVRNNRCKK